MLVGLLYEGDLDENPLQTIIRRIIKDIDPQQEDIQFVSKPAHGSIEGHIRVATILFFETYNCDFAIFVADSDNKKDKPIRIKTSVSRNCQRINSSLKYVVACPEPEFEQWFFDEEDAIKNLYPLLPATERLPYKNMDPKERIKRIISENDQDITVSRSEIYNRFTETININKLYTCSKSFKRFYNWLKKVI